MYAQAYIYTCVQNSADVCICMYSGPGEYSHLGQVVIIKRLSSIQVPEYESICVCCSYVYIVTYILYSGKLW